MIKISRNASQAHIFSTPLFLLSLLQLLSRADLSRRPTRRSLRFKVFQLWGRTRRKRSLLGKVRENRQVVAVMRVLQRVGRETSLALAHLSKLVISYARSKAKLTKYTRSCKRAGSALGIRFHQLSLESWLLNILNVLLARKEETLDGFHVERWLVHSRMLPSPLLSEPLAYHLNLHMDTT